VTVQDRQPAPRTSAEDLNLDLGFGPVVARESRARLLNRDGTFNVRREGLRYWESLSLYHYFLTMSWPKFMAYVIGGYVLANTLFALGYVACGDHALSGFETATTLQRFLIAFFFSVETIATIGYGHLVPRSLGANLMMTVESLFGLLVFAVVAGIGYARFARPKAELVFSRNAVIGPYRDIKAFMFRIANQRSSELLDVAAKVILARRKKGAAEADREFVELKLERDRVAFFPLAWTIVHPIDKTSPLWDYDPRDLLDCDVEFLVLLNGFDETFSQTVHARSSYKANEVVWGARFKNIFNPPSPDGKITIDIRKLHEIDRVPLPA
jgi:inward rectifier potassium channel